MSGDLSNEWTHDYNLHMSQPIGTSVPVFSIFRVYEYGYTFPIAHNANGSPLRVIHAQNLAEQGFC